MKRDKYMDNLDVFLDEDRYISYNDYKNFCVKNDLEVNEDLLNERNSDFVERKLVEYKEYFDHIFTDVGENIKLDDEKRKIN